jgi:hypothetical protein
MTDSRQALGTGRDGDGLVYVVPPEALRSYPDDVMTLLDMWHVLWGGKWTIAALAVAAAAISIAYALTATKWYQAEVLLAPAQDNTAQGVSGALGSLAALTGVGIRNTDTAESVAMLRSREFTQEFIEEENLLPVLFDDVWDEAAGAWITESGAPPDVRDAVRFFDDNVRNVIVDRTTGFVTLRIEWTDADIAADWANSLVRRLNDRMRLRALEDPEENVHYLQTEFSNTSVVTLQQSIGRLLEAEMQKLMLARGNEEFAFRVLDRAQAPNSRVRPQRSLIVAVSVVAGGMAGVLLVLLRHSLSAQRGAASASASHPL